MSASPSEPPTSELRFGRPAQCLASLVVGGSRSNEEKLAGGPRPSDDVAGRIRDLMELGEEADLIVKEAGLMVDTSWTSEAAEQGHASGILKP